MGPQQYSPAQIPAPLFFMSHSLTESLYSGKYFRCVNSVGLTGGFSASNPTVSAYLCSWWNALKRMWESWFQIIIGLKPIYCAMELFFQAPAGKGWSCLSGWCSPWQYTLSIMCFMIESEKPFYLSVNTLSSNSLLLSCFHCMYIHIWAHSLKKNIVDMWRTKRRGWMWAAYLKGKIM